MASCPQCDDGYIYVGDAARPCPDCARARNRAAYSGGYHPGGRSAMARFQALQRVRGRRSAAKRRALAKGKPARRNERTRELALGRAYPKLWQLDAAAFETLYRQTCEAHGWTFDRRGLKTAHKIYVWAQTRYRACGQGYEFTNEDVGEWLEEHGRPRCRRTIQLTRKRLEAMGLFTFEHVKRGTWIRGRGWQPGEKKDTIRATALHVRRPRANCTLPTGAGASPLRGSASCSPSHKNMAKQAANDLSPPPTAADEEGARTGAEHQGTEREQLQRALDFQRVKLDVGVGNETVAAEVRRLRQALRLLDDGGGPP